MVAEEALEGGRELLLLPDWLELWHSAQRCARRVKPGVHTFLVPIGLLEDLRLPYELLVNRCGPEGGCIAIPF
jgi:hypothetical protein